MIKTITLVAFATLLTTSHPAIQPSSHPANQSGLVTSDLRTEHFGQFRLAQYQSSDSCLGCPSNGRQLCYFECEADKQDRNSQCDEAWWLNWAQKTACKQINFEVWRGCRRRCEQEFP
jgi:hypothetical protein